MCRRLTVVREARSWSKSELARRANLNSGTVVQIENGYVGTPYPSQLAKLAAALDWPPERAAELLQEVDFDGNE